MNSAPFSGIADFYDLVYADKDTVGEAQYVEKLLTRHGVAAGGHLLEWGSGTGRHASALSRLGYRVSGIEREPAMLARAQLLAAHNSRIDFRQGDLLNDPDGHSYDALIACFHVISYLIHEDDIALAFANARRALKSNGVFLFDVWHGPAVVHQKPETRSASYRDGQHELVRIAAPTHMPMEHRVDVHYRYFYRRLADSYWQLQEETHKLRYWSVAEIRAHASAAGLNWLGAEEWLTGLEPTASTWGVCHILSA